MPNLRLICQCLFSPRLLKVYSETHVEDYFDAGSLDRLGDRLFSSLSMVFSMGWYTSPVLAVALYRRGYCSVDGLLVLTKLGGGFGLLVAVSLLIRACGRASNPTYVAFLHALHEAQRELNKDTRKAIMKYDCEFWAWPVGFKWSQSYVHAQRPPIREHISSRGLVSRASAMPCQLMAYLLAHSIGVRLVYPGSISALQYVMGPVLLKGRVQLVNTNQGERFKLQTSDRNNIDAMFVDRRRTNATNPNGQTLVICSEGNAGFYEVGIMVTPLEAGYSVLGWNHPGFGGSTGMPYIDQEINAMDAVMQFAITELGFLPESIILFGWSIGGFASSWAAMHYPDVKGVVLDATFDDIMTLAVQRMPAALEPLVKTTIRSYLNLNNYEMIAKYPGPIALIRRTEDEVLCTEEMNLGTNRGNDLLIKLLQYRYPLIVDGQQVVLLNKWLSVAVNQQAALYTKLQIDNGLCAATITSYVEQNSHAYPMLLGDDFNTDLKNQMALFLAVKYMTDFRSSHCTPLPTNMFHPPAPWRAG